MTRLADELRAVLGTRDHQALRPEPSPAVTEEEAASRLYGERTGTVNASPTSPPVGRLDDDDSEQPDTQSSAC